MTGLLSRQFSASARRKPLTLSVSAAVRSAILLSACATLFPAVATAQDDAFLECAELSDRVARVNCLETALESAVSNRATTEAPAAPVSAPVTTVTAEPAQEPAPATDTAASNGRGFDLFGLFQREPQEKPDEPSETMQAVIANLEYFKPDVLTISLENGQIWRQRYMKRYNLREGDVVRIYSTNWGQQYRLEAERFNGFIQVERLK